MEEKTVASGDVIKLEDEDKTGHEVLTVSHICKKFRLSRKQKKITGKNEDFIVAVNDLSFSAYKGEIFGLLGPNGAGKTTTLRILSTLIKPDGGDATVEGASVLMNPETVRSQIGFLTSELKLEDFFTPDYLFDFFSELHGVDKETRDKRKKELFAAFGIDEFAGVKVKNLSTGMKQKASLAISLVHDPSVIIFDEPTNGLDVITAKTVTDFLLELKRTGHTVVVSTHIFSLVDKICDRVGIIVDGKMIKCGTLKDVCGEKNTEDAFFDVYYEYIGGKTE